MDTFTCECALDSSSISAKFPTDAGVLDMVTNHPGQASEAVDRFVYSKHEPPTIPESDEKAHLHDVKHFSAHTTGGAAPSVVKSKQLEHSFTPDTDPSVDRLTTICTLLGKLDLRAAIARHKIDKKQLSLKLSHETLKALQLSKSLEKSNIHSPSNSKTRASKPVYEFHPAVWDGGSTVGCTDNRKLFSKLVKLAEHQSGLQGTE